jgi:hypothetical protein
LNHFILKNDHFCQDRLGTSIGKVEGNGCFSQDKRWKPGAHKRTLTGQDSYVNTRALTIRHAAAALRSYEHPITSKEDLQRYQNRKGTHHDIKTHIGPSLKTQVLNFLQRPAEERDARAHSSHRSCAAGDGEAGDTGGEAADTSSSGRAAAAGAAATVAAPEWTPDLDRQLQVCCKTRRFAPFPL